MDWKAEGVGSGLYQTTEAVFRTTHGYARRTGAHTGDCPFSLSFVMFRTMLYQQCVCIDYHQGLYPFIPFKLAIFSWRAVASQHSMCVRLCRTHIFVLLLYKNHCELRVLKATENRTITCVGGCIVPAYHILKLS